MEIFRKGVAIVSLCTLLAAPVALATDKGGLAYAGNCGGFTIQSSDANGNVEYTLKFDAANIQMKLTCGEGKEKREVKPEEKGYQEILDNLKFPKYSAEWTEDYLLSCK